jgi:4-amino-4-deoxy-L-arabinose transferase-like glycosyltransferase
MPSSAPSSTPTDAIPTPSAAWLIVLVAAVASLAVGFSPQPLWDEDEPRFAVIARTMVETGDWIVPMFNGELAVDKPVLMHWAMAAAMTVFGPNEFAARLPSALATLATALALVWAGGRWIDRTTGVVAALAFTGCLLVGIEAHAATPDAILVALVTWATVLAADALLVRGGETPRLSVTRAGLVGGLLGLAVVCKGPVGFVGPLAVLVAWSWWRTACARATAGHGPATTMTTTMTSWMAAAWAAVTGLRPVVVTAAALATALPWYTAVSLRTEGAWTAGFFLVHNVGRFMAPMEKHGGGVLFHPLTMLVGLFPWSCFLPLAIVVAGRRVGWNRRGSIGDDVLRLALVWLGVWVIAFSAAATKLPNYVLPAYPAAALLMACLGVAAARHGWQHPRWMSVGVASLAFGGLAMAATILVGTRHGLTNGSPAAVLGIVPVLGAAACWVLGRSRPLAAVSALVATGLITTALACGPAASWLARANTVPAFVEGLRFLEGRPAPIAAYMVGSPNVVFYAGGRVTRIPDGGVAEAAEFLTAQPDGVLLLSEERLDELSGALPPGWRVVDRARPLFRHHDLLAIRGPATTAPRTARADGEATR